MPDPVDFINDMQAKVEENRERVEVKHSYDDDRFERLFEEGIVFSDREGIVTENINAKNEDGEKSFTRLIHTSSCELKHLVDSTNVTKTSYDEALSAYDISDYETHPNDAVNAKRFMEEYSKVVAKVLAEDDFEL